LCVLAILPVGWQVYRRKHLGMTLIGPGVIIILLTSGAMFSWVLSPTFAVPRPASMLAVMEDEQASMLLQALLKNIYRAFSFSQEQDVYDKLALTVSDRLREDIYLQHRQTFAIQKTGGTQARIRRLEVQAAKARPVSAKPLAYEIHGQWSALGTVSHWGYLYKRENTYDARITVGAEEGVWKVTGLELLEQQQRSGPELQPAAGAAGKL
jgi:hypothetical protein